MTNEIKVGDKVRVSKDAPKIYTKDGFNFATEMDFEVVEIEDDCARVENGDGILTIAYALPTKYLIKVEDEAKEPKYKKGDRVMHKGVLRSVNSIDTTTHRCLLSNLYYYAEWVDESDLEPYAEPTAPKIKVGDRGLYLPDNICGIISKCDNNHCVIEFNDGLCCCTALENVELVQTKEQMEANANDAAKHCDIPILSEIDRIKVREFIEIHPFDFESLKCGGKVFEDMYWDAYTADLAKEISVKIVNKNMENNPKEVGEYSVKVAKSVVEELKRK